MHRQEISRWEQGSVLPVSKTIVLELAWQLRLDDYETRQLLDASLIALQPLWGVPLPRNSLFTGRDFILETIHQALIPTKAGKQTQMFVLHGLGGIGKTQTALEYAYRHALEYRAIFWVEADTLDRVLMSLRGLLTCFAYPSGRPQSLSRCWKRFSIGWPATGSGC